MNRAEFRQLLWTDRGHACRLLAARKVDEWMNDGTEEVVRVLTNWLTDGINLSDADELVDMAFGCGLVEESP